MSNAESEFQSAIAAAGLTPPDTIEPGRIHRFPGAGKGRGNTAGRCFMFPDMRGGWYEDYSSGSGQVNWQASGSKPYSQAERQANIERSKAANEAYKAEKEQAHAAAALAAEKRFNAASNCTEHAYLSTKAIKPHGIRLEGDKLLIPIRDKSGRLRSLQTIAPDGDKRFQKDGEVTGCYHAIGKPSGTLIITEGYATGASVHQATGEAVAVAFNAGNLEPVALALRAKYPALKIIIAADDDYRTAGNPGTSAATEAALAVGGFLAVPDFGVDRPDGATDFNDLHQITGLAAVKACIKSATLAIANDSTQYALAPEAWPELQPLIVQVDAEDYPLDALPAAVRCAVVEVADFVKAPIPLIASSALAALSLAIQAHTDVERAEKLTGPTGLFLLAIADSGERKSTCDGFFTSAIHDYQAREQEAAKPFMTAYKSDMEVWEAQRSGLKEKIKALAKDSKPSTVQVQQLHEMDNNKPIPPRIPRLIYGDATPEALTYSLAKVWPSGGVISSEAGSVFGGHGMGSDSVMRNLAALNQLWDGATLPVERRSSESFTVRGARLTMALQVQEATIRAFFANTKGLARGTGFLARFLVSWPQSTQGMRHFTEAPANWPALANFNNRLTAILNRAAPIDDDGALTPAMLTLSPDAKAAWVQFHNAIESELSTGRELYDVRDVASKTADNAARLAALFHTFNGSIGAIDIEAMESAARVTAWHLTEARRFLGELAMPAELANRRASM
jgi:putative DNA primase/helicase